MKDLCGFSLMFNLSASNTSKQPHLSKISATPSVQIAGKASLLIIQIQFQVTKCSIKCLKIRMFWVNL
nr:hypothetical protein [Tanacetum cinerariifolium]